MAKVSDARDRDLYDIHNIDLDMMIIMSCRTVDGNIVRSI